MAWFLNLRVATKLIFAFLILAVITMIVGVIGIQNLRTLDQLLEQTYEKDLLGISAMKETIIDLNIATRLEKNVLLAHSAGERQSFIDALAKSRQALHANLDGLD